MVIGLGFPVVLGFPSRRGHPVPPPAPGTHAFPVASDEELRTGKGGGARGVSNRGRGGGERRVPGDQRSADRRPRGIKKRLVQRPAPSPGLDAALTLPVECMVTPVRGPAQRRAEEVARSQVLPAPWRSPRRVEDMA